MLKPEYERQIGNYDDEEDMCNQLGLNYDEIYDYSKDRSNSNDED